MTTRTLPVLPLRDIVVFPHRIVPLFVGREKSVAALEAAMAADKELFLVAQLDPSEDDPDRDALYDLGVIATAMQLLKLPDGTVRVLVEGAKRARLVNLGEADGHQQAEVETVDEEEAAGPESQALMRSVIDQFENYAKLNKRLPAETSMQLGEIDDPSVARRRSCVQPFDQGFPTRQALLGELNPGAPHGNGICLHGRRTRRTQVEKKIRSRGQAADGEDPARILLNEQLKAIQRELGNEARMAATSSTSLPQRSARPVSARKRAIAPMRNSRNYAPWLR
jgi:ATP-dependent Lon protease